MNVEVLRLFCHEDDDGRNMSEPWSVGEFTFATNGHLLIKVPRLSEVPEIPNPINVEKVWPVVTPSDWLAVPKCEAPVPVDCPKCKGKIGEAVTCPECGGDGEVEFSNLFNTYEVECASCNGAGEEPICSKCEGTGKVEVKEALPVGCSGFSKKYLALLGTLPGCQIGTITEVGPACFRFDGGEGLIMPMTRDTWTRAEAL